MASRMDSIFASTTVGSSQISITVCGSLRRCPVVMQTMVSSLSIMPISTSFFSPATEAALAGSTPMPSSLARSFWAARISSSVTDSAVPPVSRIALRAFLAFTGFPIRIADATVSGLSSGVISGAPLFMALTIGQAAFCLNSGHLRERIRYAESLETP